MTIAKIYFQEKEHWSNYLNIKPYLVYDRQVEVERNCYFVKELEWRERKYKTMLWATIQGLFLILF